MAKHKVAEKLVTPVGEARYAWLDKPDSSPMGKNKYKCAIVLDKGVPDNDAFAKKLNDLHKSVKGKRDKAPVKDGDVMAEDNAEKYEWARGKWVITAKSKEKVKVVDSAKRPTASARSGDLIRLAIYVQDYDHEGSTGVTVYLNAVQLLERRNFGRDDSDAFDDLSDKYKPDSDDFDGGSAEGGGASGEDDDGDY